jgi:hypothetical protein
MARIIKPEIDEYVTDPQLLGLSISPAQRVCLRSIYGLPLDPEQQDIYRLCTGRESYAPVDHAEVTALCGARAGKDSRIATPIASYEACFGGHERELSRGERAVIPLVAPTQQQTAIAFGYIESHFRSPLLASRVDGDPLANQIRLKNGIDVMCFPCIKSKLRGWSIPVGVMDEVAFFRLEGSADSDVEVQQSIRRGMVNFSRTKLVKISTPYMKSGILYDDFKNHFGQDSPDILVWRAPSRFMNPTLSENRLEREKRLDQQRFAREYEAEFAEDVDQFLPGVWIDSAVVPGRRELPPVLQ